MLAHVLVHVSLAHLDTSSFVIILLSRSAQPSVQKFAAFLATLVLEGFAAGGVGLLLGAVAPSTDVALALFPPILVLMIIFNGFNIAEENAPRALRLIPKVTHHSTTHTHSLRRPPP